MAVPLEGIGPLLPLLQEKPFGLLSDIDGTLSPIAPRPEDAYVPDEVRDLLAELSQLGVALAFITGRPLDEARRRVGLEQAAYAGNHGLELWLQGKRELAPGIARYMGQAQAVQAYLERLPLPGVRIENKGPIIALHYRLSPDPEASRQAILDAVAATPPASAFRLHEGKMIVELRPLLDVNKGTAARSIIQALNLRSVLCLGDDVTDLDMFAQLRELSQSRAVLGASVAVSSPDMPVAMLDAADYSVPGVPGVQWLLQLLVKALA
ncbi:MAG TPA: trehalose-phosphatase [Dehalococcoidia bacterium]|nr:trehalose-phosphatase [Dehalococcoidia bacterium]